MGAARILIVEDDAILAAHKEDTLTRMGYQVVGVTATGEEAIDMALSQQPDVVLIDIRLRGAMTGIQVAEAIHSKADIPIIYLTAYTDDLLVEQAKITEPYAYLAKPVGDRELRASLEMALYKHRAELLVRQERDRAQQYLDIAGVVILALDLEGKITLLNRRGYELLGYQPGELDGKDWINTCVLYHQREELKAAIQKLIIGEIESVEFYENPVLTKSGQARLVAWHNTLIKDQAGNVIGTLSSGEDITERKRAEEALKREQNLMTSLMDNLPDAIYFKDRQSRFIRINQATADKHGLESPEQAIGKTDLDYFVEQSAQAYINEEQEIIRTGKPVVNLEEEELWPGRSSTWASTTKMPLYDESGMVIGTFGISRDITERKIAEHALMAIQEHFQLALRGADLGFWDTNYITGEAYFNDRWFEMLGYTAGDLEPNGQSWPKLVHPDDFERINDTLNACLEGKSSFYEAEYRMLTKSGEYKWILARAKVLERDKEGKPVRFTGTHQDITERKRSEQALKKRATQLELLNEIAHQIGQTHAVEEVLRRVVSLTQELFGYQHVGIFTLDHERKALVMRARSGAFARLFPEDHMLSIGQGMVGWVCQNGRSLLANDVNLEPNYINLYPNDLRTRSELTVPIKIAGEVLGILDIQSDSLNAFDANDLIVMETLANQVSVALENARLVQSLEQELGEKEVLLREIHHRVKNNLEVILSLADMQSRRVDDLRAKECLRVLQERIRTIALVHESLYRSPSLAHIQTQRYLQQLTDNLYTAFGAAGINLIVQSEDIEMGIDTAMPCGLIVTELVTNAFKYAFPADQANGTRGTSEISKEIKVTLKQVNSQIELQVSDNGIGMAEDLNWQNSKSLGLRLVTNLAGQLHGLLDVEIQNGTRFRLTFPRPLRGSPDG